MSSHESGDYSVDDNSNNSCSSISKQSQEILPSSEIYNALLESNKLQRFTIDRLRMKCDTQAEFISIAAHELKTPIIPILGTIELLQDQLNDIGKEDINIRRSDFETLSRNAQRLERIASNILEVTRIENQSLNLRLEYFDLIEVVLNVIKDFTRYPTYNEKHLDIKLLLPQLRPKSIQESTIKRNKRKQEAQNEDEDANEKQQQQRIYVHADKIRITQVISHIIDNALKTTVERDIRNNFNMSVDREYATRSIVLITIEKNQDSREVVISVRDEGKGIEPEMSDRLFEKFATKSLFGTGLGLYISKNIVEAHGGRIWGANNDIGMGATFAFSLPIKYQ